MTSVQPRLPDRPPQAHKGTFGHVLVIAGCRSMPGAAALVALAAGRCGAGLVTVATPLDIQPVVAGFAPWYMVAPMPSTAEGELARESLAMLQPLLARATVVVAGPGLGQGEGVAHVVNELYRSARQPMVLDADALNVLAARRCYWQHHGGPRILTPHPGEMKRLAGSFKGPPVPPADVPAEEHLIREFAAAGHLTIVAKSHRTLVTDGETAWHCEAANPALATGGSGDVLSGIVGAMLAQGLDPLPAAVSGCALHSLAGEVAAGGNRQMPLVATDLIDALPGAFRAAAQRWTA